MATAPKRGARLSALGRKAETVLRAKLAEIEKDLADCKKAGNDEQGKAKREPRYSLTDFMKVMDRVLKLEAIRNKVADDGEGGFYGRRDQGAE